MSVKIMQQVFERSASKGNDRLVLLALADEANDEGTNAWPSINTIAFKAGGIDERTARRCIRNLEELGELRVDLNAGGTADWRSDRRPNLYTVLLAHKPKRTRTPRRHPRDHAVTGGQQRPRDEGADCPPVEGARGDTSAPDGGAEHASRGDTSAPDGGAEHASRGDSSAPQPVKNPCMNPSPKPPHSGGSTPRSTGTNPRALGTSPRDHGTNPRGEAYDEIFTIPTDVTDDEFFMPVDVALEQARQSLGGRTR